MCSANVYLTQIFIKKIKKITQLFSLNIINNTKQNKRERKGKVILNYQYAETMCE